MSALNLIKKVLPWLVTAIIVGYIGWTTDLATAWLTLKNTNFIGFIPTVLAVVIVVFLFDTGCLTLLFKRFSADVTYKEMLPLKGASYFLNVINYNAAAAGIALFFRNKKGVPFLEALSVMLWMSFIDIVALATLMLCSLTIMGDIIDPSYQTLLIWSGLSIYLILIGSCIYWSTGFNFFVLGRFRSWRIFSTFDRATMRDYALFIALRTGFVTTYVISQWVAMPFFDMNATLLELLVYVPVLTFVGTIPLTTIAGLGTVQVMMREFFINFAPDGQAQIDAYSTTTILCFVFCRIAIGYFYMSTVAKDFGKQSDDHLDDSTAMVK